MRLHRLKIQNLNSFYGLHQLDFDPDLSGVPVFLIHGPTGSGKTTLLDAICLALFGATPRLDESKGNDDRKSHQVMSSGTGECFAELTFSRRNDQGRRDYYRATWSLRRAYGKPEGAIQQAVRKLEQLPDAHAPDGEVLTDDNRAKYFGPAFEQVLNGMELDDFLRTVILPQGKFAEFLHGDEAVKTKLIKQLTDVSEFKSIGQACAERYSETRQAVHDLTIELNAGELLSDEAREALSAELASAHEAHQQARAAHDAARAALDWHRRHDELQRDETAGAERLTRAQKALEEHSESIAALELDRNLSPAREPLRDHDRVTRELATRQARVVSLDEKLPAAQERARRAAEAFQKHRAGWASAEKELTDAALPLNEARALDTRKSECLRALEASDQKHRELNQTLNELRTRRERAEQQRTSLERQHQALLQRVPESPWSESLHEEVPIMGQHIEALKERFHQLQLDTQQIDARLEELDNASHAARELNLEIKNSESLLEVLTLQHEAHADALTKLLDGASDANEARRAWTAEIQRLDRLNALFGQASRDADTLHSLSGERAQAVEVAEKAKATLELKSQLAKAARQAEEQKKRAYDLALKQKDRAERRFGLIEARELLENDKPCPVCGSSEHPYAGSELGQEELRSEQDDARELVETLTRELEGIRAEVTKTGAEHSHASAVHDNASATLTQTTRRLNEGFEALRQRVEPELDAPLELRNDWEAASLTFQQRAEAAAEHSDRRRQELDALESAVAEHQASRERLQGAREALVKLTPRLEKEKADMERLRRELDALQERVNSGNETTHAQTLTLSERLRELERPADVGPEAPLTDQVSALSDHLNLLSRERELRNSLSRERDVLEKKRGELDTEDAALQAQLHTRQESLDGLTRELEGQRQTLKDIVATRAQLFEGQPVDAIEARLKTRLSETRARLEDARQAETDARATSEKLQEHLRAERAELQATLDQRARLQRELEALVTELAVASLDELRTGVLDETTREELDRLSTQLRQEYTTANELLDKIRSERQTHLQRRPDEPRPHGEVQEQVERLELQLHACAQALGKLQQQLEDDRARQQKMARGRERLEALQREHGVWKTIHTLIGTRGGESFERHALSFHLQNIAVFANHHLQELAPRYALKIRRDQEGLPQLDFEILDRNRANSVRPVTTLSGGESFLISLSLAMALADMRQVHMPLETLMLDEGFGTLDQESLQTVIGVLNSLQARSNRQIGLISHVEGLKESVEYRVRVSPEGNGRSSLHVERPDVGLLA
ncbi:hypothetical protein DL240_05590 [Lujinxingia litoralis]|uniref:Rad50/SbcC-type AAA domain-containing protein n=1 Tax=Lujinxingia litoralis TaxID=2211119 RepID=A0A328C711_9DELT|nr:AAA family ATPase [Lujinxingia litoralis]RAL23633.1 hypothetical protein DL240_05590 [Lujinxingia litoralis]